MNPSTDQPMTDTQALTATLAADAAKHAGEHPELDQLADYLAGSLSPEKESRVQDHLVACRPCTTQLLDLETLSRPDSPAEEGVADLAKAAGWREQKTRVADLENARNRQRTLRWASAIAASFFVATVGLSVHVSQLRQTVAGLQAPEINPQIVHLDSAATRNEAKVQVVKLRPEDRSLLLALTPTGPKWPEYVIEVLDGSGTQVWTGSGFALSEFGTIRLQMPRALLPADDYEVRLQGLDGERREQLETFRVRIQDQ